MLEELRSALEERDAIKARVIIRNAIMWNSDDMELINKMIELAEESDIVFENYDNEVLSYDEDKWSQEYLDSLLAELLINFSRERLILIVEILKYLKGYSLEAAPTVMIVKSDEQDKNTGLMKNFKLSKEKVAIGILGGLAVAAIVWKIARRSRR